jgi:DNA-binding MarR family transcriptional regulator
MGRNGSHLKTIKQIVYGGRELKPKLTGNHLPNTMDTDELHAVLEEAGLSPYQADAYETLLELGSASASEIATTSGVPQPRIYDVLRGLEDDGYVTTCQYLKV